MAVVSGVLALGVVSVLLTLLLVHWLLPAMMTYLHQWRTMRPIPTFPGAYPLIGHALTFKTDAGDFFKQLVQITEDFRNQPLVNVWLGPIPLIIVFHPETVEVVLSSSKHIEKAYVYRFLHPWLGTGLLTSGGDKWRGRRKMLTPSFHFSILEDFLEVMQEQAQVLVGRLEALVGGAPFDCCSYIKLCTLDIICETAMGKKIYAQSNSDSEYVRSVYIMSDIITRRQRTPWYWPNVIHRLLGEGAEEEKRLNILHSFTQAVIKERAASKAERAGSDRQTNGTNRRQAFLDLLLQSVDEGGSFLSHADIQEEVDTFMFEGHDTTASALGWALHLLGSHPDVQTRVQEELHGVLGPAERPVTADDLRRLQYLDCVIKETLRLFPPVPIFARTVSEPCHINGFAVPSGVMVLVVPYALHRDPRYFPEPDDFRPERFLSESIAGRHPYAYLPFSAGPRNCIGQRFAMMEEKVLLAWLLRRFHVRASQTREELRLVGDLILRPKNGIWITLEKRTEISRT